jgi:hypothetical protein
MSKFLYYSLLSVLISSLPALSQAQTSARQSKGPPKTAATKVEARPNALDLQNRCNDLVIDRSVGISLIFYNEFMREVARIDGRNLPRSLSLPIDDCDGDFFYVDIAPSSLQEQSRLSGLNRLPLPISYSPRHVIWKDQYGREVAAKGAVVVSDVVVTAKPKLAPKASATVKKTTSPQLIKPKAGQ